MHWQVVRWLIRKVVIPKQSFAELSAMLMCVSLKARGSCSPIVELGMETGFGCALGKCKMDAL